MAPPVVKIPEVLEEEVEDLSSAEDYEEVIEPDVVVALGELEIVNPIEEVPQEVEPPQPVILPVPGMVAEVEDERHVQELAARILAGQKQLLALEEDKRVFEAGFMLKQTEMMAEHKTAVHLVGELAREVRSLETCKTNLQQETIVMEKKALDANVALDEKLHQYDIAEIKVQAQQERLGLLREQLRSHEEELQDPGRGSSPPGPRAHDHTNGGEESVTGLRSGPDTSTPGETYVTRRGENNQSSKRQKQEDDLASIERMKEHIDLVVAQRLSSMMDGGGNIPYTNTVCEDSEEDTGPEDGRKPARKRKEEEEKKDREPASRRHTMLPQEIEIFNQNPTISGLGLDVMAGRGGNASHVKWTKERTRRLTVGPRLSIPAKKQAVQPIPFTGLIPWKKWYIRFCEDMESNGWNEAQILGSLKWCLRDGPGDDALWAFEEHGDGTLQCLVVTAAWICGPIHNSDPTIELENRKQKKGESFRTFGLALRRLAKEAFEGLDPSQPWLVRKVGCLFIAGLYDEGMLKR